MLKPYITPIIISFEIAKKKIELEYKSAIIYKQELKSN